MFWPEISEQTFSAHDWFKDRDTKACFIAYIDNVTNIMFERFVTHEGFREVVSRYIAKYINSLKHMHRQAFSLNSEVVFN